MLDATRESASQIRLATRATIVAAIFMASTSVVRAEQSQRVLSFQIPERDLPAMNEPEEKPASSAGFSGRAH